MTYPTGTVAMSGSAILFITGSTLTEGSNTGSDAFDDKAIVAKWEVDPSDNTSVQLRIPKEITGQKQDRIAFYMSGSGRVGIGTKDPQAAFDVRDTSEKDNVEPEEYDSDAAQRILFRNKFR